MSDHGHSDDDKRWAIARLLQLAATVLLVIYAVTHPGSLLLVAYFALSLASMFVEPRWWRR